MYRICSECKKKLSGNSMYALDQIDRRYMKVNPTILWGCLIDEPMELLDGSEIRWTQHILENEDLKEYMI